MNPSLKLHLISHPVMLILFVLPVFLLSTLFTEPRVGKVLGKRLEEDTRSCRNHRYVYSLLAGMMAITHPFCWLMQQL